MHRVGRWLPLALLWFHGAAAAEIVINEIMYNTPGSPDVEYVELYNGGASPVLLDGWYLLDDDDAHDRCPLQGMIGGGGYLVVTGCAFGLGNTSDTVRMFDSLDQLADSVTYQDGGGWPSEADGEGPSLELLNPVLDNGVSSSWAASVNGPPHGTPGAQNSVFLDNPAPLIGNVVRDIPLPGPAESVVIRATVADTELLAVVLMFDTGLGFNSQAMYDDGLHDDDAAGDQVYGATIDPSPDGTRVRYYIAAVDSLPQTVTDPATAPDDYYAYTVGHQPPLLVLNEVLASNQNGAPDPFGDTDDWVELCNPGPREVDVSGTYLSDNPDEPRMWELPSIVIGPGHTVLIWCDDETFQGPLHAAFRLARGGGEIGLFDSVDHGNVPIAAQTFGPQSPDVSVGFFPDDADSHEYLALPTPGSANTGSTLFSSVCINELLTASQIGGVPDWVELYNRGATQIDISGWHLSDDAGVPDKYAFPPGTLIPAGGHLTVDENELGFGFGVDGSEVVLLTLPDGETGVDYVDYGPQLQDVSHGRYPDGTANWHFFSPATRDLPNSCDLGIPMLDPVTGLRFEEPATLVWDTLDEAQAYDAVRGDLQLLRATGGDYSAATNLCQRNNLPRAEAWTPGAPPGGQGWFYLVRAVTRSCGFGTFDADGPSQVAPRDDALAAAPGACP